MKPEPFIEASGVVDSAGPMRTLATAKGLVQSLRPQQWIKNLLIFSGLIFSRTLLDPQHLQRSIAAFVCFCLASSAVYLLNDLCDLDADRKHPIKRLRPLAAGTVPAPIARLTMLALLILAGAGSWLLRPAFAVLLAVYLCINIAYSLALKHVVILDVMLVAAGFVLRAVAGAVVISVVASPWLVLCTLLLSLMIGFGKRRHELVLLQESALQHRASLEGYSEQFLDAMMTVSSAAAVVSYALYTMADETAQRFHTRSLVLTVPFVLYGVFRYLFLVHKRGGGGDPARLLASDWPMMLNGMLWVATVCLVVYGPKAWLPW